jgi:hypothetical protein
MSADKTRHFTVEFCDLVDMGGIYKGKSPSQAARKAARKLFKMSPKRQSIPFTLRETTQGSDKKEYDYIATKRVLDTPKVIQRGPISITVTTEYIVKPVKK